jgi:putative endonuclease
MSYYVYILTNPASTVLYAGVTNDLVRRVYEHKEKVVEGFTTRYNLSRLVYYDSTTHTRQFLERSRSRAVLGPRSWHSSKT